MTAKSVLHRKLSHSMTSNKSLKNLVRLIAEDQGISYQTASNFFKYESYTFEEVLKMLDIVEMYDNFTADSYAEVYNEWATRYAQLLEIPKGAREFVYKGNRVGTKRVILDGFDLFNDVQASLSHAGISAMLPLSELTKVHSANELAIKAGLKAFDGHYFSYGPTEAHDGPVFSDSWDNFAEEINFNVSNATNPLHYKLSGVILAGYAVNNYLRDQGIGSALSMKQPLTAAEMRNYMLAAGSGSDGTDITVTAFMENWSKGTGIPEDKLLFSPLECNYFVFMCDRFWSVSEVS